MAAKFGLIVLACALALCNAEAPFRGYSNRVQQQQAAPYAAAGFRPERTFDLPSEALAQQLRLAQIIKLQQRLQQQQQQQQQQRPSQLYGAPAESEASQPQLPSGLYDAPQEEAPSQQQPQLTRPQRPSQFYGAPQESAASQPQPQVVRPLQPSRQYGAPLQEAAASQRQVQRLQRVQQPSRQYGPPQAPSPKPAPEGNSSESAEETKEVETVAAVANSIDNKPGRLTQGRDTENDEAETTTTTATAQPTGFVLVPFAPAGYAPQKLAYFQAPAAPAFAKLQLPTVFGVQQPNLLASQLLAPQGYYQPQQLAFAQAAPLQAW